MYIRTYYPMLSGERTEQAYLLQHFLFKPQYLPTVDISLSNGDMKDLRRQHHSTGVGIDYAMDIYVHTMFYQTRSPSFCGASHNKLSE